MNRTKWVLFLLLGASLAVGKERETAITPDVLQDLRQSFTLNAHLRAAYHALSETDANELAVNREKINAMDSFFSNKIDSQKITDQQSTGRCWLFAGLNILRPVARENLGIAEIEFSQSYLFFYDKLEKANMFLEGVIRSRNKPYDDRYVEFLMKNTIPDGGQWVGMVELIKKYGVVPKEVFPESYSSSHSKTLNRTLELKLKETASQLRNPANEKRLDDIKRQAMKDVYRILAVNFGEPPRSFRWRFETKDKYLADYKTYTPQSFYAEEVGVTLADYVCLCSVPTRDFNRVYEIDLDKSVNEKPGLVFLNVPLDTLKNLARRSVLDNSPVWFGCDVGQEVAKKKGLMIPELYDFSALYDMPFDLTRKELFETYTDVPNHAMVFTGLDLVNGSVQKWLVENSWDKTFGNDGYFYMQDGWFDFYVQMLVVQKKYISAKSLKLFDQKPELLPPWDPMYRALTVFP